VPSLILGDVLNPQSAPSCSGKPGQRAFAGLLRPIARRMRQRLLMFLKPNQIAHVDIAAA